jgi:hypothetical protein
MLDSAGSPQTTVSYLLVASQKVAIYCVIVIFQMLEILQV